VIVVAFVGLVSDELLVTDGLVEDVTCDVPVLHQERKNNYLLINNVWLSVGKVRVPAPEEQKPWKK
jgi:hypothetical protein